jgi:hypothetical protein
MFLHKTPLFGMGWAIITAMKMSAESESRTKPHVFATPSSNNIGIAARLAPTGQELLYIVLPLNLSKRRHIDRKAHVKAPEVDEGQTRGEHGNKTNLFFALAIKLRRNTTLSMTFVKPYLSYFKKDTMK